MKPGPEPAAPEAVGRKVAALGLSGASDPALVRHVSERYHRAYASWLADLVTARIGAVVCDYDGTVCWTGSGHALPLAPVRRAVVRLLDSGCLLGVASGRGRSLHRELRAWVPRDHWPRVLVGMYSGGVRVPLTDDVSDTSELPRPDLSPDDAAALAVAHRRLADPALADLITLDRRLGQLTVKPHPDAPLDPSSLARITATVLGRPPVPAVRLATSGYAVDVVPLGVTKAAVVADLAARLDGDHVLAIGDHGQPGGNDHELLACVRYSLSVDKCSADPSRCWNLAPRGILGPDALVGYLDALVPDAGRLRLAPTGAADRSPPDQSSPPG